MLHPFTDVRRKPKPVPRAPTVASQARFLAHITRLLRETVADREFPERLAGQLGAMLAECEQRTAQAKAAAAHWFPPEEQRRYFDKLRRNGFSRTEAREAIERLPPAA